MAEYQSYVNPPSVRNVIIPLSTDLGPDFTVQRALPSEQQRMVGPFIFFDQMGPAVLTRNSNLDVRPHPHICLATVTYLFSGEILHRDSLGNVQTILPGAVNWMTAGSGIVHSERTPPRLRAVEKGLFGIQAWVALPRRYEETAPEFLHYPEGALPFIEADGVKLRLIAGSLYGENAPTRTYSDMFYADAMLAPGAELELPAEHAERAIYIVGGGVSIGHQSFDAGRLVVFKPGASLVLRADPHTRLMLLGGEPLDGARHVWWNFVASSRERIEQAKEDWLHDRFGRVPGDSEFIPLPEEPPPPITYP
ncbi:MAG TPA: pirin family protein [Gammaproteobacteria bacterium]|nr:pirin family protein [Gammaproteobacteria bacterium]